MRKLGEQITRDKSLLNSTLRRCESNTLLADIGARSDNSGLTPKQWGDSVLSVNRVVQTFPPSQKRARNDLPRRFSNASEVNTSHLVTFLSNTNRKKICSPSFQSLNHTASRRMRNSRLERVKLSGNTLFPLHESFRDSGRTDDDETLI